MSESISQLPLATQANATDLIPATQGSIGPGSGTTRAVTQAQIIAAGGTVTSNITLDAGGGWSSNNVGKQLLVTTPAAASNPGIGITDSNGTNLWGVWNNAGVLKMSVMPAYSDGATGPTNIASLSSAGIAVTGTLSSSGALTVTGGGAAVTGATVVTGSLSVVGAAITLSNNQPIGGKDNLGVAKQMLLMDVTNNVTIQNGGGQLVRVTNQAASTNLMTIDDGGVVTLGAGPLVVTGSRVGAVAGAGELNSAGVFTAITGAVTFSANFTQAVLSGVAFYAGSDERAKDDLSAISASDAEAWVMAGKPLTFLVDGVKHAGFSAQDETKTVRRESITAAVSDDPRFATSDGVAPDGHRLLKDYQHDIAYLTRFAQTLVERIAALEAKPQTP